MLILLRRDFVDFCPKKFNMQKISVIRILL